jgi:hypothetical protein
VAEQLKEKEDAMKLTKKVLIGMGMLAAIAAFALLSGNTVLAAPPDKDVIVVNTPAQPVPVTGTVNANVTNTSLPVTGSVNANITNSSLPVTGSVGALVQLPTMPFFGLEDLITISGRKAMGTSAGTLGVTSITISNFNTSTQQLFLFNPLLSDQLTGCDGSKITGGTYPQFLLLLEPNKTLQLQFPTALVFTPIAGLSCLAAEVTTVNPGTVEVSVNGFVQ